MAGGSRWLARGKLGLLLVGLLSAVMLAAGLAVLLLAGPQGASSAPDAALAPDGPVHFAGTLEGEWLDPSLGVTHLRFAGAPDLDVRTAGATGTSFGPGDYLEVQGTKSGATVAAGFLARTTDPVEAAAPYLAIAGIGFAVVLAGPLARHFPERIGERARAALGRPPASRSEDDPGPQAP